MAILSPLRHTLKLRRHVSHWAHISQNSFNFIQPNINFIPFIKFLQSLDGHGYKRELVGRHRRGDNSKPVSVLVSKCFAESCCVVFFLCSGFSQPESGSCWQSGCWEMFQALHSLGLQTWDGGNDCPWDSEDQLGKCSPSAEEFRWGVEALRTIKIMSVHTFKLWRWNTLDDSLVDVTVQ